MNNESFANPDLDLNNSRVSLYSLCPIIDVVLDNSNNTFNGNPGSRYRVYGNLGHDTISGSDCNDTLYGGNGEDVLSGNDGDDQLEGNQGNDFLRGNEGDDLLKGQDGDDTVWGDLGNDTVRGGDGNDTLSGYDGDDLLQGHAGDDELFGGKGNDTLNGGSGYDTLTSNSMGDQDIFVVDDSYIGAGFARITDFDVISFPNETNYDLIDVQGSLTPNNVDLNLVLGDTWITQLGDLLAIVENVDLTSLQSVHLI